MKNYDQNYMRKNGLVIDLFAGGGGFSIGCEKALKRPVDIALNHDRYALALHSANHPSTRHICQAIEDAIPLEITKGKPVYYLHASPSCTQFSRSRRALPAEKQLRDHAWRVLDWVKDTEPMLLSVENVAEFKNWGPLDINGFPDKKRKGEYWDKWKKSIRDLGYDLEYRVINSADLGATTSRERLIVFARRDGNPICWPKEEYGKEKSKQWRPVADKIDWSVPAPSIFTRKKPLAEATITRLAKGLRKFVIETNEPFIAPEKASIKNPVSQNSDKIASFMAQNHALLPGRSMIDPLSTICAKGSGQSLVYVSFMHVARNNSIGSDMRSPALTICAGGSHLAEVLCAMRKIDPKAVQKAINPIIINGKPYLIEDIGMRFLTADELWEIQGFDTKKLKRNIIVNGKPLSLTRQRKMIGNSVVPLFAQKIVEANIYDNDINILNSQQREAA